jgi:type VI secretion system ImpB/VipA family protein
VGVLADFSGQPAEALQPLKDRRFIEIDRDNFDEVLAGMNPGLKVRVQNTLNGDGSELAVPLRFENMEDFEPGQLVRQIEPLRILVRIRSMLNEVQYRAEDSPDLAEELKRILKRSGLPADSGARLNEILTLSNDGVKPGLSKWAKPELIPQITAAGGSLQMVMLRAGWVAFWAFDFEEKSNQGLTGRDEFLDRVKEPIRRPPANMAAFTMEQHLLAHGVIRVQIAAGPSVPGQYEMCGLKTIDWYAAQLVSPKA